MQYHVIFDPIYNYIATHMYFIWIHLKTAHI